MINTEVCQKNFTKVVNFFLRMANHSYRFKKIKRNKVLRGVAKRYKALNV